MTVQRAARKPPEIRSFSGNVIRVAFYRGSFRRQIALHDYFKHQDEVDADNRRRLGIK